MIFQQPPLLMECSRSIWRNCSQSTRWGPLADLGANNCNVSDMVDIIIAINVALGCFFFPTRMELFWIEWFLESHPYVFDSSTLKKHHNLPTYLILKSPATNHQFSIYSHIHWLVKNHSCYSTHHFPWLTPTRLMRFLRQTYVKKSNSGHPSFTVTSRRELPSGKLTVR